MHRKVLSNFVVGGWALIFKVALFLYAFRKSLKFDSIYWKRLNIIYL